MSARRRVLFAGLFHETHTFVEGTTGLRDFTILRGEELFQCAGDSSPMGGALESARTFGWEVLPSVDFRASPSATVDDAVIDSFWNEFESIANRELAQGLDAIYLVLHGAMVSRSLLDVEGEMLQRIRKIRRAEKLPIFGVFDLHANFTEKMALNSNCLVAYRENPHTDARHAAQHAAALLERCFRTGQVPRTFWHHPPMMWAPTGTATEAEPMFALEKMARTIEKEAPQVWCANVIAGFSFADMPETGVSFSISTTGSESHAKEKLKQMAELAWQKRSLGAVAEPAIQSVMERLPQQSSGLTVLVEPSDNIGAGAPGDGTGILRALVQYKRGNSAVCINDPAAVQKLQAFSLGERTTLSIGGKGSVLDAGPLMLEVEVVSRSNGRFELEDKQSHLASMTGDYFEMGPCTVVQHEGIYILLTSNKTPPFDLGQWRSQGIEPTKLSLLGVKAAVAHRRAYDPIAQEMLWVNTPGPCSSDLKSLPYQNVQRPIYPLDHLD